tara:strand:- start:472 stop:999 length:528 start_codon:yes stop_codon:yes gene_type:complete
MAVTFHSDGRIDGFNASSMPTGSIIQTVVASAPQGGSSLSLTGSITSPTFLHSDAKVTITPQRSNSKILLTWTAQIRLDPSAYGFVGVFYSANSNMSSPSVIEKYRGGGANLNESYRTVTSSHYMFQSWSRTCVDETISNNSVRYYNVGGYATGGTLYHGDNGVACTLIAQEIAS